MNAYTLYVRCEYDSEDPVPARKELYSIDISESHLAFAALMKDALLGTGEWDIESLLILPSDNLCAKAPDRHFNNLSDFINHFGGIRFKPTPPQATRASM